MAPVVQYKSERLIYGPVASTSSRWKQQDRDMKVEPAQQKPVHCRFPNPPHPPFPRLCQARLEISEKPRRTPTGRYYARHATMLKYGIHLVRASAIGHGAGETSTLSFMFENVCEKSTHAEAPTTTWATCRVRWQQSVSNYKPLDTSHKPYSCIFCSKLFKRR